MKYNSCNLKYTNCKYPIYTNVFLYSLTIMSVYYYNGKKRYFYNMVLQYIVSYYEQQFYYFKVRQAPSYILYLSVSVCFEFEWPNGNLAVHKSFELPSGHSHSKYKYFLF